MSKNNSEQIFCIDELIPFILQSLGWKKVKFSETEDRWIDPNQPECTPSTSTYAWYVSKLRVENRTDTKFVKLTNGDIANFVS